MPGLIAALVGIVHIAIGVIAWVEPAAIMTVPLALFAATPSWAVSAVMMSAGGMALVGVRAHRFALMAPQQVLLVLHSMAAAYAIASGQYADGYVPDGGALFIAADQSFLLALCVAHSAEFLVGQASASWTSK